MRRLAEEALGWLVALLVVGGLVGGGLYFLLWQDDGRFYEWNKTLPAFTGEGERP